MVTQMKPSAKRARDLYEAAVDHFGTSHPGECFCLQGGVVRVYSESLETNVVTNAVLSQIPVICRNLEKLTCHFSL